ncbi:MAG TPA: hypothetical protein VII06_40820 [Chloroflexota bacterium]|jgi:CHASE3 domain sensor protein
MSQPVDEPLETFLARLPADAQAALAARLGSAVLAASRAAACVARTGRHQQATTFELLTFLHSARTELEAADELLRGHLLTGEPPPKS